MTSSPEEIRQDIERTRRELSSDVDALHEKVSPSAVAQRRVDAAKGGISKVKERVMGSAHTAGDGTSSGLGTASDKVGSAATSVKDSATSAPDQAMRRTQGNPMAAGLIAFGAGWLLSSLLPASQKEQQAATGIKDKASEHSDALTGPLKDSAQEMKENLREPAQQAAQSVRSTATDAADNVRGEAVSAKGDVTDQARHAKEQVQSSREGSDDPLDLNRAPAPSSTTYGS